MAFEIKTVGFYSFVTKKSYTTKRGKDKAEQRVKEKREQQIAEQQDERKREKVKTRIADVAKKLGAKLTVTT